MSGGTVGGLVMGAVGVVVLSQIGLKKNNKSIFIITFFDLFFFYLQDVLVVLEVIVVVGE
jgi:hypothetical protein